MLDAPLAPVVALGLVSTLATDLHAPLGDHSRSAIKADDVTSSVMYQHQGHLRGVESYRYGAHLQSPQPLLEYVNHDCQAQRQLKIDDQTPSAKLLTSPNRG